MAESNDNFQKSDDLDQLLNNALNEFNNPNNIKEIESTDDQKHRSAYDEAEGINLLTDTFKKLMDSSNDNDFDEKAIEQFGKLLEENIKNIPNNPELPLSDEEMAKIWEKMTNQSLEDGNEMYPPFFLDIMQKLLAKDVLYPPLKDLSTKFPDWLTENKDTLSDEDFERFTKQHELVDKVCSYYEEETEINGQIENKKFTKILTAMQEMQKCGQPPEELVAGGQNANFQSTSMEYFNKLMEENEIDRWKTM